MTKLAIVGTGFVGASLGLALRPSRLFDHIAGADVERGRAQAAKRAGAIDEDVRSPADAVRDASVVIVTVPGEELGSVLADVASRLSAGAVVSDTSRWKAAAVEAARELPPEVYFVGGRPVLDNAGHGPEEARADVFTNAVWCLTPGPHTNPASIEAMSAVAHAAGAQEYFLSPDEHDALSACGELLPPAILAMLALTVTRDPAWQDTGRLAGDTLNRLVTQAEALDASFWHEASANATALSRWIDAAIDQLGDLRERLAREDPKHLHDSWKTTLDALGRWRRDKRSLQESTMPPKEDMRPNLLGNIAALNRLRGGQSDRR
ncbi:MAG: prephenate dehydrogenase [Chloroflexi bacterium]|nr:prephenate dehydrogenase [Chloroflexota bacterium]